MKKLLSVIVLGGLLAVLAVPMVASAQPQTIPEACDYSKARGLTECTSVTTTVSGVYMCDVRSSDCAMCCMLNTVYKVTDWVFYILMLVGVIMLIIGGFTYIAAAGDPERAGKGKKILVYAIIGIAIALLAKVVPSVVKFIVGV